MYQFVTNMQLDKFNLKSIGIQGEFCGPKINGNKMGLKSFQLYVFNVKDLSNNQYYGLDKLLDFVSKHNLQMVPILDQFICDKSIHTIQWFQDYANNITYQVSKPGEGIVIRPCEPIYSSTLGKNLSCKVINQKYKD
jgi:ATP-dependent RNA circularization protein (DNA/RNA ligase family)